MVELQLKGLFYNCDDKYFPRHKCKEENIFVSISEDVSNEEVEASLVAKIPPTDDPTPPVDPPEAKLLI
jgi:hypothetical protein